VGSPRWTPTAPVLIVFCLSMLALNALPLRLATYRELGFLRRLAVTPVGPSRLLAAQLTVYAGVAVAAIALILAIGATAYHLRLPGSLAGLAVTLLLTAAALLPLGLWITSTAPTAKSAGAIGSIVFFALAFSSGLWWPLLTMPHLLRAVMEKTPTGATVQALTDTVAGHFPRPPAGPGHLRRRLHRPGRPHVPMGVELTRSPSTQTHGRPEAQMQGPTAVVGPARSRRPANVDQIVLRTGASSAIMAPCPACRSKTSQSRPMPSCADAPQRPTSRSRSTCGSA